MSQLSATSRRVARTLAQRAEIDWSRPVWTIDPEMTAYYNKLRTWVASSNAMAEKYQKPPAPVDFSAAKKAVRDTKLVDMLEAFYKSNTPPAETHVMPAEEVVEAQENMVFSTQMEALFKEFIPVIESEIEFVKNNRTTVDTTMADMQANYPLIHEEIEDELERREWFKDTGYSSGTSEDDHHHH